MFSNLKTAVLTGLLMLGSLSFLSGCNDVDTTNKRPEPAPTQSSQQEELLTLNRQLTTQYDLYKSAVETSRYSATVNGHAYSAAAKLERDQDFQDAKQAARDAYNRAREAYNNRDVLSCNRAMNEFGAEIAHMNSIGWYATLHKMRTSSDTAVQQVAYDNGYRDNKSWRQWHNSVVLPRTRAFSLWSPSLSSTGASADFGPGPDFND